MCEDSWAIKACRWSVFRHEEIFTPIFLPSRSPPTYAGSLTLVPPTRGKFQESASVGGEVDKGERRGQSERDERRKGKRKVTLDEQCQTASGDQHAIETKRCLGVVEYRLS